MTTIENLGEQRTPHWTTVSRLELARRAVAASYTPCLNPGVVIVDRSRLEELLSAAHGVTGGRE